MRDLTKIKIETTHSDAREIDCIGFCGVAIIPAEEGNIGLSQMVVGDMNIVDLMALYKSITEELLPTMQRTIMEHMLKVDERAEAEDKAAETIHRMAQLAEEGEH